MAEAEVRPLRTVLFAAGDDEGEVAAALKSGADSIVIDLEEPRTPCTEPVREQARRLTRGLLDATTPGPGVPLIFARVQPPSSGQTLKDLRAVMGPSLFGILLPKVQGPADVHGAAALLTCLEGDLRPAAGVHHDLPDPRDGEGDPQGLRDRHRVGAGRLHGRRHLPLR